MGHTLDQQAIDKMLEIGVFTGLKFCAAAPGFFGGFRGLAAKDWDWEHIFERHWEHGAIAIQRNKADQIFKGMNQSQIKKHLLSAWANRKRIATQLDKFGNVRIQYLGIDSKNGKKVFFGLIQERRL